MVLIRTLGGTLSSIALLFWSQMMQAAELLLLQDMADTSDQPVGNIVDPCKMEPALIFRMAVSSCSPLGFNLASHSLFLRLKYCKEFLRK